MAKRKGQVVTNTLVTPDTRATFPVVSTNDIGGGRHIVQTLNDRNAIPADRRVAGMLCRVIAEGKDYILKTSAPTTGNTSTADWEEFASGVPAGVLTKYQTVEEIEYGDSTTYGYTKLIDKLNALDTSLAKKIESHQAVEDLRYTNSVASGFSTLVAKLTDMDSKIATAGTLQNIEDINWKAAPTGHYTALSDELKAMNDPTKILITNTDGTTSTLKAKIDALVAATPKVEDISNTAGVPLSTLLTNASDPDKIIVDTTAGTTLTAKLAALTAAAASTQHVEDIEYSVATTEGYTKLTQKLADMNDPGKIMIGTDTLTQKLATLTTAAATALQHVEDIEYSTATSEGYTKLTQKLADINDPGKIIVDTANGTTLTAKLATLTAGATGIQNVEDIIWKTTPTTPTGISNSLSTDITDLFTKLAAAQTDATTGITNAATAQTTANAAQTAATAAQTTATAAQTAATAAQTTADANPKNVEDLKWKTTPTTPAGIDASLSTNITDIYTKIANVNDPGYIMIGTDTLTAALAAIKSSVTTASEPPQHLLYNVNSPEAGVDACEYLTMSQVKLTEIAYYTNADATMATNLTFKLEICGPSATAYSTLAQGTFTLGASQSGKLIRTDLSALTTPIYLADNTRIRINITSLGASDTIGSFNVRLTMKADATSGVTTNVTA